MVKQDDRARDKEDVDLNIILAAIKSNCARIPECFKNNDTG